MPEEGEIKRARDIGKVPKCGNGSMAYVWRVCPGCGDGSWVVHRKREGKPVSAGCRKCKSGLKRLPPPRKHLPAPVEGEVRNGAEIGRTRACWWVWHRCEGCGKLRWTAAKRRDGTPRYLRCARCGHGQKFPHPQGTLLQPQVGDVRLRREVGVKGRPTDKMVWRVCPDCGDARWVVYTLDKAHGRSWLRCCLTCNYKALRSTRRGEGNPQWKGGRRITKDGYVVIHLQPDDPYYCMADRRGNVREHRLVMARSLDRPLKPWEIPDHQDLNPGNNRIENLKLRATTARYPVRKHKQGTTAAVNIVTENQMLWRLLAVGSEEKRVSNSA